VLAAEEGRLMQHWRHHASFSVKYSSRYNETAKLHNVSNTVKFYIVVSYLLPALLSASDGFASKPELI